MTRLSSHAQTRTSSGPLSWLAKLHNIKIGSPSIESGKRKPPRRDLAFILRNLATLVENGLSLPRSLATLAREKSLNKYSAMLQNICHKIESGESFSSALAAFPGAFNELIVNQIRVGERSGTVAETLSRISDQLEKSNDLKAKIIKRLSYPIVVTVAGSGVVAFMLMFVVPQFEETYRKARIPLPLITRWMMAAGHFATHYGWLVLLGAVAMVFVVRRARQNPIVAQRMDRALLRLPLLGSWLRDIAVLQFMEVLGIMMQSGFKLVDALSISAGSVSNYAVRGAVEDLKMAVVRGEKLSHELDKHSELFPPVVSQLVIVGEQTGNLSKSTQDVRVFLQRQVERKADILVGALEPALTILMAAAIGVILLAIYLPMFSMVDAVDAASGKK